VPVFSEEMRLAKVPMAVLLGLAFLWPRLLRRDVLWLPRDIHRPARGVPSPLPQGEAFEPTNLAEIGHFCASQWQNRGNGRGNAGDPGEVHPAIIACD
jgi:hypothetical protein